MYYQLLNKTTHKVNQILLQTSCLTSLTVFPSFSCLVTDSYITMDHKLLLPVITHWNKQVHEINWYGPYCG